MPEIPEKPTALSPYLGPIISVCWWTFCPWRWVLQALILAIYDTSPFAAEILHLLYDTRTSSKKVSLEECEQHDYRPYN
jgi:hypothetical protein